jgi:hypothetical protein
VVHARQSGRPSTTEPASEGAPQSATPGPPGPVPSPALPRPALKLQSATPGPVPVPSPAHALPASHPGPSLPVAWHCPTSEPTTGSAAGPRGPAQSPAETLLTLLGGLSLGVKLTIAQMGDVVKTRSAHAGGPTGAPGRTLRELARAAKFSSAVEFVHSIPAVRVAGASSAGQLLYTLGASGSQQQAGLARLSATPVVRSLPVSARWAALVPPSTAPPPQGVPGRGHGGAILRALGKAVKSPKATLVSRQKLHGLADTLVTCVTVAEAARTHRRRCHLVLESSALFHLLCQGKVPLGHGGAHGVFLQDLHLLCWHCTAAEPLGPRQRVPLLDAVRPLARAVVHKAIAVGQLTRAASTSTHDRWQPAVMACPPS